MVALGSGLLREAQPAASESRLVEERCHLEGPVPADGWLN